MARCCHVRTSPYLFNSCEDDPGRYEFEVRPGDVGLLAAAGVPAGVSIPVEMAVGPYADGNWVPYAVQGQPLTLSSTSTMANVVVPGWYSIDTTSLTLPTVEPDCVKITADALELEHATNIPHPFTCDPCDPLAARGVQSGW